MSFNRWQKLMAPRTVNAVLGTAAREPTVAVLSFTLVSFLIDVSRSYLSLGGMQSCDG